MVSIFWATLYWGGEDRELKLGSYAFISLTLDKITVFMSQI